MGQPTKGGKSSPSSPKRQPTKKDFFALSDDQQDKVDGDVGLARHACGYIVQAIGAGDQETLRLLNLAFAIKKGSSSFAKQVETVVGIFRRCNDSLQTYSFMTDSDISGACIDEDALACFIGNNKEMEKVLVLSDVPMVHDYFATDPTTRATMLIHEFVHAFGFLRHPGGIKIIDVPPENDKDVLPFDQASKNPYCYQNFARWMMKRMTNDRGDAGQE